MSETAPAAVPSQSEQAPTVAHAYGKLPAQDVERARAFYAERLGLSPYGENAGHLYYQVDGVPFIIFPSTGAPSGTHDQLGLVANDLDLAVARMRAAGVTFEEYPPIPGASVGDGIMDAGHIRVAWFKDSEGNLLSIAEFPNGSPFRRH
jgi:catechol 2,3-dioxygenase-like lactoylglutathione lyase family enzyme